MARRNNNPYGYMEFNREAFQKWEEETHIPKDVWAIAKAVAKEIGIGEIEETTIELRNRGGYVYAYTKGIVLTHRTSSYADGPSTDYAPIFLKWMRGLGFYTADSYGDNGMDSATNWHDTYWTKELAFEDIHAERESFERFVATDKDDPDAEEHYWEYEREREEMQDMYYDEY